MNFVSSAAGDNQCLRGTIRHCMNAVWDEGYVLRRMLDAPGKRRRGRQKTRWKDSC